MSRPRNILFYSIISLFLLITAISHYSPFAKAHVDGTLDEMVYLPLVNQAGDRMLLVPAGEFPMECDPAHNAGCSFARQMNCRCTRCIWMHIILIRMK